VLAWHFGRRGAPDAGEFYAKVRKATAPKHFKLSSDGHQPYLEAVATNLADRTSYGMLVKIYKGGGNAGGRYSPAKIAGTKHTVIDGDMTEAEICTCHTERANGTIRCFTKRMGRLTYCFSKKWANHEFAMALHFAHYNFCRKHKTLKTSPAVASNLADHLWPVQELLTAIAA
jgi:hypothetical protein